MNKPLPMTDEEFNSELKRMLAWVKFILEDDVLEDFVPVLAAYSITDDPTKEREIDFAVLMDFDQENRYQQMAMVGTKFADEKKPVVAIYFVSEAWVSKAMFTGNDKGRRYAHAADDPNRIEIIQVAGRTYDGRCNMASIEITRTAGNKMIAGAERVMPYGGEIVVGGDLCKSFFEGFVVKGLQNRSMN